MSYESVVDCTPESGVFVTPQHGLLGFARSAQPVLTLNGIRTATVQPTSPPGEVILPCPSRFVAMREVGHVLTIHCTLQDAVTQT